MLLVSKIINNAREIKSRIGEKSYDNKVLEYYTKLTEGLSMYPKTDSISDKIKKETEKWDLLFKKDKLAETDTEILKKLKLPGIPNMNRFTNHLGDLVRYNDSEFFDECSHQHIEFETTCFPRAILFYISVLDFYHRHWPISIQKDVDEKIKKMPDNLNFFKGYITERAKDEYDSLCDHYNHTINNVNKETFIEGEITEYSRILKTHKTTDDWNHIREKFNWRYFTGHSPEEFPVSLIEEKLKLLGQGKFYEVILEQDTGLEIMIRLLSTERYIAFLKDQLTSDENKNTSTANSLPANNKSIAKLNIFDTQWPTFKFKKDKAVESSAITDLLNSLKVNNFVDEKTTLSNFRNIFSGDKMGNPENKIIWTGTNAELHYFIDRIFKTLMRNPKDEIWKVTSNCFKLKNGADYELKPLRQAKTEEVKGEKKERLNKCADQILSNL